MPEKKGIKVNFLERKNEHFIESYYANKVTEFCMLDDDFNAIHPQVRCKDYIQDLFWIVRNPNLSEDKKNEIIYGFKASNYLKYPLIDKDIYRVGIRFRTEGQVFETISEERTALIASRLKDLEDRLEFPTSNVFVDESKQILVFEFNPKWVEKPYLLSFYLLFIRILFTETVENLNKITDIKEYLQKYPASKSGYDASFINKSTFLLDLMFNKEFPEQLWTSYDDVKSMHNTSGIVSYSNYLKELSAQKSKNEKALPARNN